METNCIRYPSLNVQMTSSKAKGESLPLSLKTLENRGGDLSDQIIFSEVLENSSLVTQPANDSHTKFELNINKSPGD